MKRIILTIVISFTLLTASAQMRSAYFMEGSYFRTDMNPALVPHRGYFTLPALGGIGVGMHNNMLSVDNLFYNRDGQTVFALDSRVSAEEFLGKLPNKGHLSLSSDINLLSVGFSANKMFWNFGIKARLNADIVTSKDMFRALKSLGNNSYDLSSVGVDATAYGEIYLGAFRSVTDWLNVGARVKGLVGMVNAKAQLTQGNFSITRSQISGSLRGQLRVAGAVINPEADVDKMEDISDLITTDISGDGFKSGGFGADLGAEARFFDEHLRVSLAVTDLGFISWSAKSAQSATAGYNFTYSGVNINTGEVNFSGGPEVKTVADTKGFSTRLNTTLNVGVEYNILNNWIAFGLLSHTEFRQLYTLSELTASVNFRVAKCFTATFSHTFCGRNRPGIFGAAINIHTAGLNLFLGADYIDTTYVSASEELLIPKYQKSLNCYFGLGFGLGKNKL